MLKPSGRPPNNRTYLGSASFVSSNGAGTYDLHVRKGDDISYLKMGGGGWGKVAADQQRQLRDGDQLSVGGLVFYVRIPGGGRKRAVTEETPAADCRRACTGSLAERAAEMEFHALRLAQLQHEVVSAGGLEGADKALALKALRAGATGLTMATAAALDGRPLVGAKQMAGVTAKAAKEATMKRRREDKAASSAAGRADRRERHEEKRARREAAGGKRGGQGKSAGGRAERRTYNGRTVARAARRQEEDRRRGKGGGGSGKGGSGKGSGGKGGGGKGGGGKGGGGKGGGGKGGKGGGGRAGVGWGRG